MARIENTSDRQYDIHGLPDAKGKISGPHKIPKSAVDDKGKRTNGVGEIPDAALADLLANDPWTKGVFESGDLVKVEAKKDDAKPKDPPKA